MYSTPSNTLTLHSVFSLNNEFYESSAAHVSLCLKVYIKGPPWVNTPSDSFTILALWALGLAVTHISESNCKVMSSEHYFS